MLALTVLLAGCATLMRTPADNAFCDREPIDQVERFAAREMCR